VIFQYIITFVVANFIVYQFVFMAMLKSIWKRRSQISGILTRFCDRNPEKEERIDELLPFEEVVQRLLITQVNTVIEKFHVSPVLYSTCQRFWIELITSLSEDPSRSEELFREKLKAARKSRARYVPRRATKAHKGAPTVDENDVDIFEEAPDEPRTQEGDMEDSDEAKKESDKIDEDGKIEIEEAEVEEKASSDDEEDEEFAEADEPAPKRQKVDKQEEDEERLLPLTSASFWLTLAVLSFSLRWLRERFLVSDVVKWAQNGDIAYLNVSKLFSENKTTSRAYQRFLSRAVRIFCLPTHSLLVPIHLICPNRRFHQQIECIR
jgi:hypothetical protein